MPADGLILTAFGSLRGDQRPEARRYDFLPLGSAYAKAARVASSWGKRYYFAMPVEIVTRDAGKKVSGRKLKQVALKVLELLEQDQAELSLAIVGNTEIRKLNVEYRKRDYPTDVLSFPSDTVLPTGRRVLGDVIISVDRAQEQAEERGRTLHEEIVTLLIHGILHLLGYDHERSAKEARSMACLEKKIYQKLCEQRIFQV